MDFTRITLHHMPGTRSSRVLWTLHEIFGEALDPRIELRPVALRKGEQYAPAFAALNPNRAVPVMEIDFGGESPLVMVESGAMAAFLADAFPEAALAPPAEQILARAHYMQMLHYGAGWMDAHLWMLWQQLQLLPEDERCLKTPERVRAKFAEEIEPFLLRRVSKSPYIAGERFTAADCVMGHNIAWCRHLGMAQDDLFREYLRRMLDRPAYRAAFPKPEKSAG